MIRRAAAEKLAHDLLRVYVDNGFLSMESLASAATIIEIAVSIDEDAQIVESLQAKIAVDKFIDGAIKGAGK